MQYRHVRKTAMLAVAVFTVAGVAAVVGGAGEAGQTALDYGDDVIMQPVENMPDSVDLSDDVILPGMLPDAPLPPAPAGKKVCSWFIFCKTVKPKTAVPIVTATTQPTGEYVHLGDSYSSGGGGEVNAMQDAPGVAMKDIYEVRPDGKIHPCGRASNNAAKQIAAAKGLQLLDASCGGANTSNILVKGQFKEPRQLDSVGANTKLVTLTIGGNDAALLFLVLCGHKTGINAGFGCFWGFDGVLKQMDKKVTAMGPKVANVLAAIKAKAPNAQIRIAGYPYLLPVPGTKLTGNCAKHITAKEMQKAKDMQDGANGIIKAAAEANGPNTKYVDVHAPGSEFDKVDELGTRDMCSGSANRWINGVLDSKVTGGPYHPNAKGYQYYAQSYLATL